MSARTQAWPSLDPGKLRHQVTILKQVAASDVSGSTVVWQPFVTTYAAIEPVRGIDVIRSGQDTTQLFLRVSMNWQAGILPNMRVQSLNGLYVIQAIENLSELNVSLVLTCLALNMGE